MNNRFSILLVLLFLLGCQTTLPPLPASRRLRPLKLINPEVTIVTKKPPAVYDTLHLILQSSQPALDLYRQDITHLAVTDFFIEHTGSMTVALPILHYADAYNLSFLTVFSLVWVESQYKIHAINQNSSSIDRGLFQLNSKTFRNLSEDDFYDPHTNARFGIEYLYYCFQRTNDPRVAVAIYNAGAYAVLNGNTPQSTQRHVKRIFNYREVLEKKFYSYIVDRFELESQ